MLQCKLKSVESCIRLTCFKAFSGGLEVEKISWQRVFPGISPKFLLPIRIRNARKGWKHRICINHEVCARRIRGERLWRRRIHDGERILRGRHGERRLIPITLTRWRRLLFRKGVEGVDDIVAIRFIP